MSREATDKELSGGVSATAWALLCRLLRRSAQHLLQPERGPGFHDQGRQPRRTGHRAIFLILCGLIPKLGALVSIMPQAVLAVLP